MNISSDPDYTLQDIRQVIRDASRTADVTLLRAVYAEYGDIIREWLNGQGHSDGRSAETAVLWSMMEELCCSESEAKHFELLTVFFQELGGRTALAPGVTLFGALVCIDMFYQEKRAHSVPQNWFESMRLVVAHLVEVCGLCIRNEEEQPTRGWMWPPTKLLDLAVEHMAWACVCAVSAVSDGAAGAVHPRAASRQALVARVRVHYAAAVAHDASRSSC
jgi:hypothetical protein